MLSPTVPKNTLILYNFAKCKVHTKIEKKNVTINCQSIFFPSKIFSLNLKQSVLLPPFPKKNIGESVGVLNLIIVLQTIRLVQQSFEVYTVQRLQIF